MPVVVGRWHLRRGSTGMADVGRASETKPLPVDLFCSCLTGSQIFQFPNHISQGWGTRKAGKGVCTAHPLVPTMGTTNFKGKVIPKVPFYKSDNGFCNVLVSTNSLGMSQHLWLACLGILCKLPSPHKGTGGLPGAL